MAVRIWADAETPGIATHSSSAQRAGKGSIESPGDVRSPRGGSPTGCTIYGWIAERATCECDYSFGFFTSTLGRVTSFFSVSTFGTVIVSLTVPVSTEGV